MRDLERELRALPVEWPETPDLAGAILPRLEPAAARPLRPAWRPRRGRLVAAVVALLLGAVAAVEPARSAVLELLGLRSVKIERREPAPTTTGPSGQALGFGRAVTQAEAERLVTFPVHPPAALGRPDGVFFARNPPRRGAVSYAYRPRDGIPESARTGFGVLVTEIAPSTRPFVEKTIGPDARLERFRVGGDPAYFISGAPHGVGYLEPPENFYVEEQRLAGNTLLVERDDLLIRVEGDISRERAVGIAQSVPSSTIQPRATS
jgi:hypothetical protein